MYDSEHAQLLAFVNFIRNSDIAKHLVNKEWAELASDYNGRGYAKNQYDIKLKTAYDKYAKGDK
jgi:hypothetical protein